MIMSRKRDGDLEAGTASVALNLTGRNLGGSRYSPKTGGEFEESPVFGILGQYPRGSLGAGRAATQPSAERRPKRQTPNPKP